MWRLYLKNLQQTTFSIFIAALKNKYLGLICHVNRLPADDSHDMSSIIFPKYEERCYKNLRQTTFLNFIAALKILIRLDITCESSVIRRLTRHAKPYFPPKWGKMLQKFAADGIFNFRCCLKKSKFRLELSCELSSGRRFTWHIKSYFPPKWRKMLQKFAADDIFKFHSCLKNPYKAWYNMWIVCHQTINKTCQALFSQNWGKLLQICHLLQSRLVL